MLLVIDNYDSFTYNLVQYFQCLGQEVSVYMNNTISLDDIQHLAPNYIVISPGPNGPTEAGVCVASILHFYKTIPILGVCLGHQCLAYAFGASIIQLKDIMHGKASIIQHKQRKLFSNLPPTFKIARYHSLAIDPATLPSCFTVEAWTQDIIMAIAHRHYPVYGIQFHPESILSEYGLEMLTNFLQLL